MVKQCSKCGEHKPASTEFFNRSRRVADGLNRQCKTCRRDIELKYLQNNKEKRAETLKRYQENNKEKLTARDRDYRNSNKDKVAESNKRWRENNIVAVRLREKAYRENNKAAETKRVVAYRNKRYKTDPLFRLAISLRTRVNRAIKRGAKSASTMELIGCSIEQVRDHLGRQFKPGMSWNNYGDWHIDHKRPCASFDLSDSEQQKQCFHYTNLQPLWAEENLSKGAKWEGDLCEI